jgi:hypothetical protein
METTEQQTPKQKVETNMNSDSSRFSPQVSWFPKATENLPDRDPSAAEVIQQIQVGRYQPRITEIREKFAYALKRTNGDRKAAKMAVGALKKMLPAVTFSGVFGIRSKANLQTHSGLLCADIDNLGDNFVSVRSTLAGDEHLFALFTSPTGDGLKAVYRIPICKTEAQHKAAFRAIADRVKERAGIEVDNTPDTDRLCFISWDPEATLNASATELPVAFDPSSEVSPSNSGQSTGTAGEGSTTPEEQAKLEKIVGPVRWENEKCGFCKCPGENQHANQNGERDCRINLSNRGDWYLNCMHTSCKETIRVKNRELRQIRNGFDGPLPPIENAATLLQNVSTAVPPPEVIGGVLHKGSKAILGSSSKAKKTWVLLDLGLSVASGVQFWNWTTTKGRVCYINFEIQVPFIARRISEVAMAKEIANLENFDLWNLRGYATSFDKLLPQLIAELRDKDYSLVIIDPVYKGLGGRDENAAGDIAQLCNEIERVAVQTGAAVVFAAHFTKGNAANKESMDRISGSGVFARDADTIITMTKHEEENCLSVDLILRNFPEQPPLVVRWQYPLMKVASELNPEDLKKVGGAKRRHTAQDVWGVLNQRGELTTTDWKNACREELGLSERTFYERKKELINLTQIAECTGKKWRALPLRFRAGPSHELAKNTTTTATTATTANSSCAVEAPGTTATANTL